MSILKGKTQLPPSLRNWCKPINSRHCKYTSSLNFILSTVLSELHHVGSHNTTLGPFGTALDVIFVLVHKDQTVVKLFHLVIATGWMHIATRWMYIATGWMYFATGQVYVSCHWMDVHCHWMDIFCHWMVAYCHQMVAYCHQMVVCLLHCIRLACATLVPYAPH